MATYGGVNIFGVCKTIQGQDTDPAMQMTSYPGVDGCEVTHLGTRGMYLIARGILYGANAAAVIAAENLARTYRDGVPRTLIDNHGVAYSNVLLQKVDPAQTPVRNGPPLGSHREYTMTFFRPL